MKTYSQNKSIANIGFLLWFIAGYKIGVNAGKKKVLNKLENL